MRIRSGASAEIFGLAFLFLAGGVFAHCEIPCGIYDDTARVSMIEEHIGTIEKSMKKIEELGAAKDKNYNQLVRWIDNKELHANKIQEIVYQYFMNQRIKPTSPDNEKAYQKYITELSALHEMLVYAMQCKQTTDLANTKKLRESLEKFRKSYFGATSK
ncbi:MAG: superoxide dismutase [Chitinivibrionales bacterium]|nr:superoxide dismutase [Chitinivibrionales bacterium]MBD3395314.1 superoxide dismutase [Chitinivibrionales bacterium]